VDVNTAIRHSRLGFLDKASATPNVNPQAAATVQAMNVFLFAGMVSPSSGNINETLGGTENKNLVTSIGGKQYTGYDSVEMDSVIELITPSQGDVPNDPNLVSLAQPDTQSSGPPNQLADLQSRLNTFLMGGVSMPNTQSIDALKGYTGPASPSTPTLPAFMQKIIKSGGA
jgi:hypothetical protein